ncbi:hypothetical protein [Pedobacter sp.]|uniref:hypothetical protein n=1 Tax=Pedobacter sp. TaxID=1411316 RepID=UPI003D7F68CF
MQHIQDKDFDQLFKDQLTNAEVTPPAMAWTNIEKQLQPRPKKRLPVYWMAAALVLVALSAGLLFQKKDKIQLHGKEDFAKTTELPSPVLDAPTAAVEDHSKIATPALVENAENEAEVENTEKVLVAMQPLAPAHHLNDINTTTKETAAIVEQENTLAVVAEKPQLLAVVSTPEPIVETALAEVEEPAERNGIRNVGDLVNFVVDKVDKREQKFLKFNTDDDDQSSLVSINIGIIRLNSKNKTK